MFTVRVRWPNGGKGTIIPARRDREEADREYARALRDNPTAEVRLLDGDVVLATAGPTTTTTTTTTPKPPR